MEKTRRGPVMAAESNFDQSDPGNDNAARDAVSGFMSGAGWKYLWATTAHEL